MKEANRDDILNAIKSGTDFLRKKLLSGNYGLSCIGKNGNSKFSNNRGHLFSVFHITHALVDDINEIERTVILTRILSEEYNGQWGYSPRGYYKEKGNNPFFVDSDDTAFALRTLRMLNIYRSNDMFMNYHRICNQDGIYFSAFTTFKSDMKEKKIVTTPSFQNNLQIHPEVNANVYHTLLDTNNDHLISEQLIKTSQQKEGYWNSFFYPDIYYSTFQFMSLLQKTDKLKTCFDKGIMYIKKKQNSNGSWSENGDVYLTALALKSLCLDKKNITEIQKGIDFIIGNIKEEGNWHSEQIIWQFYDDKNDIWKAFDINNVITTSVCVEVLKSFIKVVSN